MEKEKKMTEAQIKETAKRIVADKLGLMDEGTILEERDITEYGAFKYAVDVEVSPNIMRTVTIVLTAKNEKPTIKQVEANGGAFDATATREAWLADLASKAEKKRKADEEKSKKIERDKLKREAMAKAKEEKEENK